jgi:hypothetical protein
MDGKYCSFQNKTMDVGYRREAFLLVDCNMKPMKIAELIAYIAGLLFHQLKIAENG